jgi:hypothetical protein
MTPRYPGYNVLDKWNSPSFDDTTREVLARRLREMPPRRFLSGEEWELLDALTARLLPQPDRQDPIPITPWIDAMLHDERGDGFRHPDMPPLREAWRQGLAAIDDEARLVHGKPFTLLGGASQDALLSEIGEGRVHSPRWQGLNARQFFVHHLLKSAAGIYYSHPAAWSEIGFGGPASPRGYVRLGFNGRDPWDAKEAP